MINKFNRNWRHPLKTKLEKYRSQHIQMGTMKDVLCLLNELDFDDKLDNDYLEKLVEVKKMMVREFENYNRSKLIYALNIVDEMKLSDVTIVLDYR